MACFAHILFSVHQNAFIKKRNIMDGVLTLHEIMHYTHIKKKVGIILKVDFQKACDKVNWSFLLECLHLRGFSPKWCGWVDNILRGGTVCVKINNKIGKYFQSHKGVQQGDPLSPFLFNIATECLSKMVCGVQTSGMLVGLAPDLIPVGVAILQ